ncbi:signal peptidase I [Maricaulaceae bacterium MS644]
MRDPLSSSKGAEPPLEADGAPEPRTDKRKDSLGSTLVWALVVALAVRTLLFQPFHIPSESMRPTLEAGDYVISSKWPYGYSRYSLPLGPDVFDGRVFTGVPDRGEVIVFRAPHTGGQSFIKRAIGMPGETIEMRGGVLFIDGAQVPRGLVGEDVRLNQRGEMRRYDVYEEILPGGVAYEVLDLGAGDLDDFGPVTVPAGHVFALGDNRDESRDSRVPSPLGPGPIPLENLIGRADLVLLSVRPDFSLWRPWTWYRLRTDRFARSLDAEPG